MSMWQHGPQDQFWAGLEVDPGSRLAEDELVSDNPALHSFGMLCSERPARAGWSVPWLTVVSELTPDPGVEWPSNVASFLIAIVPEVSLHSSRF